MLKLTMVALTASLLSIGAAAAASTTDTTTGTTSTTGSMSKADCDANWKLADLNADGSLDKAEMDAAKTMMPSSLVSGSSVLMNDYVTACSTAK